MSRIEASRLAQIMASLASTARKPEARPGGSSHRASSTSARDVVTLKSNLRSRLGKLRQSSPQDFDTAAPAVLIQEILLWEFGSQIAENASFRKASQAISEALQASSDSALSLKRLINSLSSEQE